MLTLIMRKVIFAALLMTIAVQDLLAQGMRVYKGNGYRYYATLHVDSLVFVNEYQTGDIDDDSSDGFYKKEGNLESGDVWVLTRNSVMNDKRFVFSGDVSSFTSLTIGHGHGDGDCSVYGLSKGQYNASRVVIDATNITVYYQADSENKKEYAHGLTIENNIQVEIRKELANEAVIRLISNGESYEKKVTWYGSQGDVFIRCEGTITDCVASWTCSKLKGGTWLFGDSYFHLTSNARWTKYLIDDGFTNVVLNGWAGAGSAAQLVCLQNLLRVAKPTTIVWCLGMNNQDDANKGTVNASWNTAYEKLKAICREKDINLILSTIPNAGDRVHDYKNAIVRASGYRYIEFSEAVGADGEGNWYRGMLSNDNVHPTIKGATALYLRAIYDAPELMQ